MFAAVEYWDQGVVYNTKKNSIAVKKKFVYRKIGINIS